MPRGDGDARPLGFRDSTTEFNISDKGKQFMNRNSIQNMIVRSKTKLRDESKLSFAAAAGCFAVGAAGWLVNLARPETTLLHGLLVVAGFYCFVGVVHLFKASTNEAVPTCDKGGAESNEAIGRRKTERRVKSAA